MYTFMKSLKSYTNIVEKLIVCWGVHCIPACLDPSGDEIRIPGEYS